MINIKKRKERKLVLVSLFTVFVIVVSYFIVSATIINYKKKIPGSDEITNTEIPVKFSYEENRDLCKELKDVSANYKDAKAWLKIPGTTSLLIMIDICVTIKIIIKLDGAKTF